jgi:hypothetical protein
VTPIVSDGTIATNGFGGGRFMPVLLLDTTSRPDVDELIRVHSIVKDGDVNTQWAIPEKEPNSVALIVEFLRPMNLGIVLVFDLETQGGFADLIFRSKMLYLQSAKHGYRLKNSLGAPQIGFEVTAQGYGQSWDEMLIEALARSVRARGFNNRKAREGASQMLVDWRGLFDLRMPPLTQDSGDA